MKSVHAKHVVDHGTHMINHGDYCPPGCHPGQTEYMEFTTETLKPDPRGCHADGDTNVRFPEGPKKYTDEISDEAFKSDFFSPPERDPHKLNVNSETNPKTPFESEYNPLEFVQSIQDELDKTPPRQEALEEAIGLVTGDRNSAYGPPMQDFERTAGALSAMGYRRLDPKDAYDHPTALKINPHDVAIFVMMVKISRIMSTPGKRDSWVDIAGYAGCGYECSTQESE